MIEKLLFIMAPLFFISIVLQVFIVDKLHKILESLDKK